MFRVIMRTDERGNADPGDNRSPFYLADAMGGHVGMLIDDDGDAGTDRLSRFRVFDAFGVAADQVYTPAGSFAWRGGEGSVTDHDSGLVYMQSRHAFQSGAVRFTSGSGTPGSRRPVVW